MKDRRRLADRLQGKLTDEILHREDLLVSMGPTEADQIIDQRLGEVALRADLGD